MPGQRGSRSWLRVFVAALVCGAAMVAAPRDPFTLDRAAVRVPAGEASIGGRLPITLSPQFPAGHGLDRPARTESPQRASLDQR